MDVCRICLTQAIYTAGSLDTFQDHRSIAELITYCSGVQVFVNDSFPQIVCQECLPQIITACRIKEICIRSNEALRTHVGADDEKFEIPEAEIKIESGQEFSKLDASSHVFKQEPFDGLEEMCIVDTPINFDYPQQDPMRSRLSEKRVKTKLHSPRSRREIPVTSFKCYLCNVDFATRKQKYKHLELVHCNPKDFKCRICKHKSQTARGIDNHLMLHENPELLSHMCHICSKNYQKACELRRHLKLSHSDKSKRVSKFFCDFCDFKTFSKMNLKRHLRTIHLKIKAFQCEHCPDKKYTSKVTLDQHMITKHGQETDYCCRCCGRKFPTMSFLRSHMKSTCSGSPAAVRERGDPNEYREHLGEEHYRCKICSVIVEGKGKIAQHYAQRHKHSNACELCPATFNSYSNLKKHIQILHNKIHKFECSFCGKRFGQKNQLQSHENTHTGAKPFLCKFDYCEFRSGDLSAVSKHQKKCPQNPLNMG